MAQSRLLIGVLLAVSLSACITATGRPYPDAAHLEPRNPADVWIYWTEPRVEYEPIGEVLVEACPACSRGGIEKRVAKAVARLGGNLAIVVSQERTPTGAGVFPNRYNATVVQYNRRDLVVIAAIMKPEG